MLIMVQFKPLTTTTDDVVPTHPRAEVVQWVLSSDVRALSLTQFGSRVVSGLPRGQGQVEVDHGRVGD